VATDDEQELYEGPDRDQVIQICRSSVCEDFSAYMRVSDGGSDSDSTGYFLKLKDVC